MGLIQFEVLFSRNFTGACRAHALSVGPVSFLPAVPVASANICTWITVFGIGLVTGIFLVFY